MRVIHSRPTRAFRTVVQDVSDIYVDYTIPDYDGLLPITRLQEDLLVKMPWWPGVRGRYKFQAGWKRFDPANPEKPGEGDLIGDVVEASQEQTDDPNTIFEVLVPQNELTHGVYLLAIQVTSFPGGAKEWSQHIRIEVDTLAPGGGAFPEVQFYPPVESSKTITDTDIVDGKLPGAFAHYEGIAPGDDVVPIINGTSQVADTITIPAPLPIEEYIPIYFDEAALLALNNTTINLRYSVRDKAGNSAQSRLQYFAVDLRATPENILAPLVPLADDGIINDADARTPVTVLIPAFDKARAGDEIVVHWGGQVAGGVLLSEDDLANDPFIGVLLPYTSVFNAGSGTVPVKYEVFRNSKLVGTSPEKSVVVDLTLIGEPDPDPTTPEHENLLPPTVVSDNGSGEQNNIPPEHYDQPAQAVISWLAKDGKEIYQAGDTILLTWGDQTAVPVSRRVEQPDVDAKVDLLLTIPATTIGAQGSGTIAVFYTATRLTSLPPHSNTSLSPKQNVTVTNAGQLPGGGTIDGPTFTVLNENDAIGPNEILSGTGGVLYNPIQIATDYDNVAVGDTVELFFVGYDDLFAGNLVPGAAYNPQPAYALRQEDLDRGYYEFRVPAVHHYAVCSQGAVEAHVIVRNTFGPTTGDKTRVFCDVKDVGSEDCVGKP